MHAERLSLLLLAVVTLAWGGSIYKWVDEKGVTHFSELPPAGQKTEALRGESENDSRPPDDWQQKDTDFRRRQIDRDRAAKEQEALAQYEAYVRRKECQAARIRLARLKSGVPLYRLNNQGEAIPLDAQARAAVVNETEAVIRKVCPAR